ncbi:hypothetical protein BC827DRAFT_871209 [Russula dissimulans]|nr:hypothetical protein BC827DRAFT_871209 [Russula dissimulans]
MKARQSVRVTKKLQHAGWETVIVYALSFLPAGAGTPELDESAIGDGLVQSVFFADRTRLKYNACRFPIGGMLKENHWHSCCANRVFRCCIS